MSKTSTPGVNDGPLRKEFDARIERTRQWMEDNGWGDDGEDVTIEHAYDYMASRCGRLPDHLGGGCSLAGSEECDFECPFRDEA